jgi:uncharacterized protein (DUF2252 family)
LPSPKTVTTTDAFATGHAHRKHLKRSALGPWEPSLRRRDPSTLLRDADAGRVPALLAIKAERMSVSPFGFFRGAAPLMAYDLSLQPHTTLITQLCGDAHIENLGAYTGADGNLVFDINDFDETMRGPFEWDVKRLATSILLAGQQIKIRNRSAHLATRNFLDTYAGMLRCLSKLAVLEVARYQVHQLRTAAPIVKILRKAERSTPLHSFDKLITTDKHGTGVFRSDSALLRPATPAERNTVLASLDTYRKSLLPERRHILEQFRSVAVGFKVVGTGSVGLRDFCVYLEGNGPDDPLFLQVKEETHSAYQAYLPATGATHNGQRVAEGQRAMQLQTDPLLGWTHFDNRDYLVRQLNDHKAALDVTTLNEAGLIAYAGVCGELLARGHARSANPRLLAGYVGNGKRFTESILRFATTYSVQTTADWKAFTKTHKK